MSIAKRSDGRWVVKYKDTDGRWKQRSFRDEAEAQQFDAEKAGIEIIRGEQAKSHTDEPKIDTTRLSELEAKNEKLTIENAEPRVEEPEKTAQEGAQAHGWGSEEDIPYTLIREVLAMHKEGMTREQIARALNDKGQGLYKSQVGALLYTGKAKRPAGQKIQDVGTRLFKD